MPLSCMSSGDPAEPGNRCALPRRDAELQPCSPKRGDGVAMYSSQSGSLVGLSCLVNVAGGDAAVGTHPLANDSGPLSVGNAIRALSTTAHGKEESGPRFVPI